MGAGAAAVPAPVLALLAPRALSRCRRDRVREKGELFTWPSDAAQRRKAPPPPPMASAAAAAAAGALVVSSPGGGKGWFSDWAGARWSRQAADIALDDDGVDELADPDSQFMQVGQVRIHYKAAHGTADNAAAAASRSPMVLLHGFGASAYSYERVLKPLAAVTGGSAVAFDRPAFGLSTRLARPARGWEKGANPYTPEFSVKSTMDLAKAFGGHNPAVLVGHSAGALIAVLACLQYPERVKALVLLCPAIMPNTKRRRKEQAGSTAAAAAALNKTRSPPAQHNTNNQPAGSKPSLVQRLLSSAAAAVTRLLRLLLAPLTKAWWWLRMALLRSAIAVSVVRFLIQSVSIRAVRLAWHDAALVTDEIINGYSKPLKCRAWDKAMLEYCLAALGPPQDADARPEQVADRLAEIRVPTLVITGSSDRIIPPWVSEAVSEAIPGARLHVLPACGHLPHEEKPHDTVRLIREFLEDVEEKKARGVAAA